MAANPPTLYGDIGSVKAALKSIALGPGFEAALRAVEARFPDGLSLPRLTDAQIETTELAGVPSVFPLLELVGTNSEPSVESDAEIYAHEIDAVFWANGDTERDVTAICERYVLAWRQLLRHGSLMPFIGNIPVQVGREEYGVVGRKPDLARPFVKAAALRLRVTTIEE